jgi:CO/xanthine dehydrogenase FAD-binding subunit
VIGDPHVRHRGTVGGSLANCDPAADNLAALLAMRAVIETNRREPTVDDFSMGCSRQPSTSLAHPAMDNDCPLGPREGGKRLA